MFSRLDEAVTGFADDCKQPDLGRSSKSIYYELIWDCLITSHQFLKNKVLFFEEKVSRGGGKRVWNSHIIIAGQSNFDSHVHQWSTIVSYPYHFMPICLGLRVDPDTTATEEAAGKPRCPLGAQGGECWLHQPMPPRNKGQKHQFQKKEKGSSV